ncbi:MAG: hypothetical protein HY062_01585 [Bacteroidetes bacterium]|nr:hypothetical protein [Bacteroidota bacterium]
MLKNFSFGVIFLLFFAPHLKAQVNIVNSLFNAYNVSSDALLFSNIMNLGEEEDVYLEATLFNGLNMPVLHVLSSPFKLKKGLNNTAQMGIAVKSSEYTTGNDAQYIKTAHQLPSGKFRYCLVVKSTSGAIEGDDLCEEFENEATSFLFLVSPSDKDTIENKNPILIWNHSDPFTLLQQGEMYRLILVELKDDQSADAGINVNSPVLMSNFLTRHDIQYPFDAPALKEGNRYGWQVQKIINNVVVNKTEAWEFVMKPLPLDYSYKYIKLKESVDASFITIRSNTLYFRIDEVYNTVSLKLNIYDEKNHKIQPKVTNEIRSKTKGDNLKTIGYNAYELDLLDYNLSKGFYVLEVINQKNNKSYLKFYVE